MTDYEHMTISNATSIDLSRTASSPTSVSVLVPSSTSTSQGSASAPRQASNTDPDLTCGLLRVNAKRADAPLWVGKSSVHQHGSFTASTDLDDVSDLGDTDRSQAAVAIAEKSVELASSAKRPPSLLDCEAAHKLMVEALQKKLGSRDDSAVDGPARVPMPPTISNGQGSDLQDRHHKVPPLESACIAGREINCARSLITGRFSKDEGAMIRMGKTPPPVPPKRPSMPVCPKRHPPPPPPRHQPRSVSECREQVNTTSAVRLSSPRTASLDDLCHASGFHSRTPAEPPVPEISPDAGHIPSGNQVYEHTSTATDFKALLDMNFSCPLEFDLPFMADDEEIGPLPITRPSRPAKVKAVALNKEGTQTQKEPPVRLPGSEGVDENGPSPRHLEVPTFHTLPSRWRGGKQGKARQVSAPCSTICEGIKSHVSISAEQIELGSSTGNADCPSTSEQQSEGHSLTRIGACPKINGHLELPLSSRDFHGYYGEEVVLTPKSSPDHKHINIIVPSWNNSSWDHAEIYLRDLSATLLGTQDRDCLRRVQHLTAVCASLRGKWDEAIRRFIACLRTPIASLQDLDDGDCAAAYWLGDLYAMQNRRVDAGIAYALAKRSSLAIGTPNYRSNLRAERCAVQLGTSESADTASTANQGRRFSPSILEDGVLCADVTRFCTARGQSKTPSFEQRRSRNSYLAPEGSLANRLATLKQMSMTISAESFRADSPWPMPYDPLFAMANVQQGRILPHEGQIVVVPNTSSFLKLPRLLSVHALQCFICNDLAWLITALRTCLKDLDIKFAVRTIGTHVLTLLMYFL